MKEQLKSATNAKEEAVLLRELCHKLALYGMFQMHAFSQHAAVLSGETNLRLLHGLDRYVSSLHTKWFGVHLCVIITDRGAHAFTQKPYRHVEFMEFTRKNPVPHAWMFHPYFEQMKLVFRTFGMGFSKLPVSLLLLLLRFLMLFLN
jgi:hypothetical protein